MYFQKKNPKQNLEVDLACIQGIVVDLPIFLYIYSKQFFLEFFLLGGVVLPCIKWIVVGEPVKIDGGEMGC